MTTSAKANQTAVKSRPKRAAASGNPSPKVSSGKEASKLATAATANSIPPAAKPRAEAARNWTDIKVGSLVIAQESFVDGWWEAIVTEVRPDTVTVRWRDYPHQAAVSRANQRCQLLAPATADSPGRRTRPRVSSRSANQKSMTIWV